jgi:hypothetical protein
VANNCQQTTNVPSATAIAIGSVVLLEQPDDHGYSGHGAGRLVPVRRALVLEFGSDEEMQEAVRAGRVEFMTFQERQGS